MTVETWAGENLNQRMPIGSGIEGFQKKPANGFTISFGYRELFETTGDTLFENVNGLFGFLVRFKKPPLCKKKPRTPVRGCGISLTNEL